MSERFGDKMERLQREAGQRRLERSDDRRKKRDRKRNPPSPGRPGERMSNALRNRQNELDKFLGRTTAPKARAMPKKSGNKGASHNGTRPLRSTYRPL